MIFSVVLLAAVVRSNTGTGTDTDSDTDTKTPPHIVILFVDNLGWANVGYHRPPNLPADQLSTPNIDALAAAGVELDRVLLHCTALHTWLLKKVYLACPVTISAISLALSLLPFRAPALAFSLALHTRLLFSREEADVRAHSRNDVITGDAKHYTYKFCSPSRSSLMTGRLPFHVNIYNDPPTMPGQGVPTNMTMLPLKLKQSGSANQGGCV